MSGSSKGLFPIELETGMQLNIQDFDALLANLDIDVLTLFGEKDLNVDWRKTRALYDAILTVKTFPDGNHNIDVSATGSMREMQSMATRRKCDGTTRHRSNS